MIYSLGFPIHITVSMIYPVALPQSTPNPTIYFVASIYCLGFPMHIFSISNLPTYAVTWFTVHDFLCTFSVSVMHPNCVIYCSWLPMLIFSVFDLLFMISCAQFYNICFHDLPQMMQFTIHDSLCTFSQFKFPWFTPNHTMHCSWFSMHIFSVYDLKNRNGIFRHSWVIHVGYTRVSWKPFISPTVWRETCL